MRITLSVHSSFTDYLWAGRNLNWAQCSNLIGFNTSIHKCVLFVLLCWTSEQHYLNAAAEALPPRQEQNLISRHIRRHWISAQHIYWQFPPNRIGHKSHYQRNNTAFSALCLNVSVVIKHRSETKQMLLLSKWVDFSFAQPEVKEAALINRWLITISRSVVKLWNDWGGGVGGGGGGIGIQLDFFSSPTIERSLSLSVLCLSSFWLASKTLFWWLIDSPGGSTQIAVVMAVCPWKKTLKSSTIYFSFHTASSSSIIHTHTDTHTAATLLSFSFSFFLSVPSSISLSNQPNSPGTAE